MSYLYMNMWKQHYNPVISCIEKSWFALRCSIHIEMSDSHLEIWFIQRSLIHIEKSYLPIEFWISLWCIWYHLCLFSVYWLILTEALRLNQQLQESLADSDGKFMLPEGAVSGITSMQVDQASTAEVKQSRSQFCSVW